MNSELPDTPQRDALNADITTTRAELGRTLEAIADKTQVKTRAKEAARDTVVGVKDRVSAGASEARAEAASRWRRLRAFAVRERLSVTAVLVGALSAAVAVTRYRSRGGSRR